MHFPVSKHSYPRSLALALRASCRIQHCGATVGEDIGIHLGFVPVSEQLIGWRLAGTAGSSTSVLIVAEIGIHLPFAHAICS